MSFLKNLPKPFFVLAPMADVTDVPFRSIVAQCGKPDIFYTEFVSAHGLASPGRTRLLHDLKITESDHPIIAQFFGTVPEHMEAAAIIARELGFDGVDINMGCPDRSIMKQGAGAGLIGQTDLAKDLIAAARQGAGDLPVAVKTRLGKSSLAEMETWVSGLLAARPDMLVMHGRTVREMSKVPAHWDLIGRTAAWCHDAGVLCVGNGDVSSRAQGEALAAQYGVDGIMIGRGIFQNPWIFNSDIDFKKITPRQRLDLLIRHTEAWTTYWDNEKSFNLMKKFYKMYVSGWPGAAPLRTRLMEAKNAEEVHRSITEYLTHE